MLSDKLQQIEKQKSKLASFQQALLKDLHGTLGFSSRDDLIKALGALDKAPQRRTRRKAGRKAVKKVAGKTAKKTVKKATKKTVKKATEKTVKKAIKKSSRRRKRTTITPQLRDDIIAAVKGGSTGAATAKKFGVSVPTIQNIKKAAGLVRKG
jgi:hypothetical protein